MLLDREHNGGKYAGLEIVQRVCRLSLDCRFAHFLSLEGLCYNVVLFLF